MWTILLADGVLDGPLKGALRGAIIGGVIGALVGVGFIIKRALEKKNKDKDAD
jgi:hypothetical protein